MKITKPCCVKLSFVASTALTCVASANAVAGGNTIQSGQNTILITNQSAATSGIDYANAQALPLPQNLTQPTSQLDSLLDPQISTSAPPQAVPGNKGSGKLNPVTLVAPGAGALKALQTGDKVTPQEFGATNHVYTTSRTNATNNATTRYYPYRAAGKLWFKIGSSSYLCSASLIKRGLIVTAAHCVANFGSKQSYSDWQFAPGYDGGVAPYGVTTAKAALITSSYFNGTDSCAEPGIVCKNDVAVIVLNTTIGDSAGWFGYGANGYSYTNKQVMISQLGYPVGMDGGLSQQRTDSQGYVSSAMSGNTVIGSLQNGGSSGGPWIVNLGMPPTLNGAGFGPAATHNLVVGVTSWGYVSDTQKEQGASPFTSNNIVSLVKSACAISPESC